MTNKLEHLWWTRAMAKPLIILVLLGLVCKLPGTQSRPRDISEHRGLYDDLPKSSQNNNGEYNISNSTEKSKDPSIGKYWDSMTNSLDDNRSIEDNEYSGKYERYVSSNEADEEMSKMGPSKLDGKSKDDLFRKRINQDTDKQLVKSYLSGGENYRDSTKMQEQKEIESTRKTQHKGQRGPKHKKHKMASNTKLIKFDFLDKKDIRIDTPDMEDTSKLEKNASDKKIDGPSSLHQEDLAKKEKKDSLFDLNSFAKENPDLKKNTGIIEDDIMYQHDQGYHLDQRSDGEFNHYGHRMRYGSKRYNDVDDSYEYDDTGESDDDKGEKDENKLSKKDGYYGYYYGIHEKERGRSLSGKDESERTTMKEYENRRKKLESDSDDEENKDKGSEDEKDEDDEDEDENNKKEEKKDDEDEKNKKEKKEDEEQDEEIDEGSNEKGEEDEEEEKEEKKKQVKDGDGIEKEEEEEEEEEEEDKEINKDEVHTDAEPRIHPKQPTSKQGQYPVTQPFNPYAFNVEDTYIESRPIESCVKDLGCPPGRICKFGFCICGPPILCMGHKKPVCGSDGFMYPSHCELHRTACMKREHIWIESDSNCMGQGQGQIQGQGETGGKKEGTGWINEAINYHKTRENGGNGGGAGRQEGTSVDQSENKSEYSEAEDDQNQMSSANGVNRSLESESASGGANNGNGRTEVSNEGQKYQKEMLSVDGNAQKIESGVTSSNQINFDAAKEYNRKKMSESIGKEIEGYYVEGKREYSSNTSRKGESAENGQPGMEGASDSQRGSSYGVAETMNTSKSTGQSKDKIPTDSNAKETGSSAKQDTGETTAIGRTTASDKKNDTDKDIIGVIPTGEGNGLYQQQEGANVLGRDSATQASGDQKKKDAESAVHENTESVVSRTITSDAKEKDTTSSQSQQRNEEQGMEGKSGSNQGVKNLVVVGAVAATGGPGMEDKTMGKTNQTSQVKDENEQHMVEDAMLNIKEGGAEMEKGVSQEVEGEKQGQEVEEEEGEAGNQRDSPILDEVQDPLFCTPQVLLRFKADVLRFHCVLFNEEHCDNESKEERQYVATEMFKYFDKDSDGFVEKEELWMLQLQENIDKISSVCSLLDLAAMNDQGDKDGKLTIDEFIQVFDIPDEVFEPKIETIPTLATVGNDLEIRCSIMGVNSDLVWQKSGMDLSLMDAPEIHVFKDGTLYIEGVNIHHIGNYSCHQRNKPAVKQINVLSVVVKPKVKIVSMTTVYPDQSEVMIRCQADGLPKPEVSWEFNGSPLELSSERFHFDIYQNTLTIRQAHYHDDTGSYKCVAVNKVGKAEDAISIFIDDPKISPEHIDSVSSKESFMVFHDNGYTMYEPHHCLTQRHVLGDFGSFHFIPEELDDVPSMCQKDGPCMWGSAVTVKDKFVYVSQPQQNRVLVVDATGTLNPRQIVKTDRVPVQLYYVEAIDEVWVLCWNGEEDYGTKTIIIIREASKDVQHHMIHMQPIGNRFDQVRNMFLPPHSDLDQVFKYGYAMHNEQQGLFKVDLQQKKYVKAVDFSLYNCVPQALAFIPIGGQVVIQCQQKTVSSQSDILLHLDTITDVTVANFSKSGTPYVTPDSRRMAVVDKSTGRITVYQITDMGEIQEVFEVTTGSSVNDVIFHPAAYHYGYNLYMTSRERSVIFSVSLENGKVETIKDVGDIDMMPKLPWLKKTPRFISGNAFSNSLSVITKSALVILNDKYQDVQCQFNDLENPTVIAYANPN